MDRLPLDYVDRLEALVTKQRRNFSVQMEVLTAERDALAAKLATVERERDRLHAVLKAVADLCIDKGGLRIMQVVAEDSPPKAVAMIINQRNAAIARAETTETLVTRLRASWRNDAEEWSRRHEALIKERDEALEMGCARHAGQVHGAEAEELRRGIETIVKNADGEVLRSKLKRLLDEVDARDSLAHLEASDEKLRAAIARAEAAERELKLLPECANETHASAADREADRIAAWLYIWQPPLAMRRDFGVQSQDVDGVLGRTLEMAARAIRAHAHRNEGGES